MPADQENTDRQAAMVPSSLNHLTIVHQKVGVLVVRVFVQLFRRPVNGVEVKNLHLLFDIGKPVELGGPRDLHEMKVLWQNTVVEGFRELLQFYSLRVVQIRED